MARDRTKYQVKIGETVVKQTANQKKAKTVFHKERARHGGKVKLIPMRS